MIILEQHLRGYNTYIAKIEGQVLVCNAAEEAEEETLPLEQFCRAVPMWDRQKQLVLDAGKAESERADATDEEIAELVWHGCHSVLKYVASPTACLAGVKQCGLAVQFVRNQTPKICLAAVKEFPMALMFVRNQTPKICLAAIRREPWTIQLIKDPALKAQVMQELGFGSAG